MVADLRAHFEVCSIGELEVLADLNAFCDFLNSLRYLCVLCVSAVEDNMTFQNRRDAEHAEIAQRIRNGALLRRFVPLAYNSLTLF